MLRFLLVTALLFGSPAEADIFPMELKAQAENYTKFLKICISGTENSGKFCYKSDQIERDLEAAGWCSIESPEHTQIFETCSNYRDIYPSISPKTVNFEFDGIEATLSAQLIQFSRSEDGKVQSEKFGFLNISCVKGAPNTISILMNKGVDFHYKTDVEIVLGQNAIHEGTKFQSTSSSVSPSRSATSDDYFFIIEDAPFAKNLVRAMYDEKNIKANFTNEFEDKQMRLRLFGFRRIDKETLGRMYNFCELFE